MRKFLVEGSPPCYDPEKHKKEVERLRKQLDEFEKIEKRQKNTPKSTIGRSVLCYTPKNSSYIIL